MIKTSTVIFAVIITMLSGCNEAAKQPKTSITPSCMPWQEYCEIGDQKNAFMVLFDVEKITPEEPFSLIISAKNASKITAVKGYAEGVNMYMGKIPLLFDLSHSEQGKVATAQVQFGSCSEKHMLWQLNFTVDYLDNNNQPQKLIKSIKIQVNR